MATFHPVWPISIPPTITSSTDSPMKLDKPQVASYGLHYHANNQLIPNATDRVVYQSLIDVVRKQLANSIDDQTVTLSMSQLSRLTAIERGHSLPACIKRLEALGLLKKFKNGLLINCDEYVTLVQLYESLTNDKRDQLVKDFSKKGVSVLEEYGACVKLHSREELLGLSGSSITVQAPKLGNITQFSNSEGENCVTLHRSEEQLGNITQFQTCEDENCVKLHRQLGNITQFRGNEPENCVTLHTPSEGVTWGILHSLADLIAKMVGSFSQNHTFEEFYTTLACVNFPNFVIEALKEAFSCGKFPNSFFDDLEKLGNITQVGCVILHSLAQKTGEFYTPVIIEDKLKDKGELNSKNETGEEDENSQDNLKKGFEGFGKVEVLDFNEPSEKGKEDLGVEDEISQQVLKRAERTMKARNSYRNKPFIRVEKVKEIIDCLDEVVKSPVDFFLYQFWWGIFDLYCDHYHPSNKIDEEGEPVEDSQLVDWKEMIGAPLPQDEVYALAKNVYEDLVGAVEQGRYVYGDHNEWEVKFNFDSFEDFIPYEIFQWSPCTMQDKNIPALRVAIDKFYNVEAPDVFTASKGDKRTKNAQNKKFIGLILSAEDSRLTPIEKAIKEFYRDFVVAGEDNIIDEFTDGKGTALESGGGLPDHLLKPWCYDLPSVGYNELTSVLSAKYKPCDGIHKKAYIFSAEKVVEWNERNGYTDTITHSTIQ